MAGSAQSVIISERRIEADLTSCCILLAILPCQIAPQPTLDMFNFSPPIVPAKMIRVDT